MMNTYKMSLIAVLVGAVNLLGLASSAYAENAPQYRVVNLQAEAVREIDNDEMQAVLYTELNEKDATALSNKINSTINRALTILKPDSQIQVSTGNQNTYPVYADKGKLQHWRGRAEIILKSKDFKATSDAIAKLQAVGLQVQNIGFNVSKEQQQKVENELYIEASHAFQQRASLLLAPWKASKYELVNLQLNTGGGYRPMMVAAASMKMADAMVESQQVEAGKSEVRVTATGSVQLQ